MQRLLQLILICISLLTTIPAHAGIVVTDDLGRTISFASYPKRVISIAPSVTETIYAVGAGSLLVGDTAYCDYPPAATKLPHIGGVINPSPEKILSLRPDVIIVASQTLSRSDADMYSKLWRSPVVVTAAATYAQAEHDVTLIGMVLGKQHGAATVVNHMEQVRLHVGKLTYGLPRPKVFVVIWPNPMVTATGKSFIGDLIRLAGGTNIAENMPGAYPSYSLELLAAQDPDFIVVDGSSASAVKNVEALPGAERLKAVEAHRVVGVNSNWADRPGPRLADGLQQIEALLHQPEKTAQK